MMFNVGYLCYRVSEFALPSFRRYIRLKFERERELERGRCAGSGRGLSDGEKSKSRGKKDDVGKFKRR